jgi:hypothetical protein
MATITKPATTNTRTGQPGSYLYSEYRRGREHQALVRRDRLGRVLPRSLAKSVPVGLLVCLVLTFGVGLPGGFGFGVFALIVVGWSSVIVVSAFGRDNEIETLRLGAEAERKTARALARLRRAGWTVLHDLEVPSADAVVGHLVIGPAGVLVINSEARKGVVRYTKKIATVDSEPLTAAIERDAFVSSQIKTELQAKVPLIKLSVYPVMVMTEADVLWKDGAVLGVTIINIRRIFDFARDRPRRLNPVEVKEVVAAVRTLFPPFVDNRSLEQVTIGRDQWLMLMETLHAIRDRDGDATDLMDRLATLEAQLSRGGDGFARVGIPPGPDDSTDLEEIPEPADDGGLGLPDDHEGTIRSLRPSGRGVPRRRPGGRPSLASVRPEPDPPATGTDDTPRGPEL